MSPGNVEIIMFVGPGSHLLQELEVELRVYFSALGNRGRRIAASTRPV